MSLSYRCTVICGRFGGTPTICAVSSTAIGFCLTVMWTRPDASDVQPSELATVYANESVPTKSGGGVYTMWQFGQSVPLQTTAMPCRGTVTIMIELQTSVPPPGLECVLTSK